MTILKTDGLPGHWCKAGEFEDPFDPYEKEFFVEEAYNYGKETMEKWLSIKFMLLLGYQEVGSHIVIQKHGRHDNPVGKHNPNPII